MGNIKVLSIKSSQSNLCFEEDEFTLGKPIWIAVLSNGEDVYQDDNRSGSYPGPAWLRLKTYVDENKLSIERLLFKFRSHRVEVSNHEEGNTFSKGIIAQWGARRTVHFYVNGILKEGMIRLKWWIVPELQLYQCDIETPEKHLFNLIRNNYGKQKNEHSLL